MYTQFKIEQEDQFQILDDNIKKQEKKMDEQSKMNNINNNQIENDFSSSEVGSDLSNSQFDQNNYETINGIKIQKSGKRVYIKRNPEKVRRWTREEALLYEKFIEIYADIMRDSSSKRNTKIFLLMSQFIGTKTPSQCRSHHQKFYKKLIRARSLNLNININSSEDQKIQSQKPQAIQAKKKSVKLKKKGDQKNDSPQYDDKNDFVENQNFQNNYQENNQFIDDDFFQQALYFKKMIGNYCPDQNQNGFSNFDVKDEFVQENLLGTPQIAQRKPSFDIETFTLNPTNILNSADDDYCKIMYNSEDKVNWRKIFNHVDQVEGSIRTLLNMIDNQVLL